MTDFFWDAVGSGMAIFMVLAGVAVIMATWNNRDDQTR